MDYEITPLTSKDIVLFCSRQLIFRYRIITLIPYHMYHFEAGKTVQFQFISPVLSILYISYYYIQSYSFYTYSYALKPYNGGSQYTWNHNHEFLTLM